MKTPVVSIGRVSWSAYCGRTHDDVVDAQKDDEAIRCVDQTVLRAEPKPSTLTGIAVGVLWRHTMHRRPTTNVAPAEVGFQSYNLAFGAGFFHDSIINGQVRHLFIFTRDDGA